MKNLKLFLSILIAGLAVVLMIRLGDAQRLKPEPNTPHNVLAATGVVTHAFSYQGALEENGAPVRGNREMVFALYANDTCTMSVGNPITYTVAISHGLFSVDLGFAPDAFNGQALWLETRVEGTTVACQPIRAMPYALGLRPGATISGSVGSEEQLFEVRSGTTSADEGVVGAKIGRRSGLGYPVGLYGYAYEYGSVGVWGVSDSQFGWGVNGIADGTESIGVRGIANAFTSTTYGVYGKANSPDGRAGYFEHTSTSGGSVALAAQGPTGAVFTSTNGTTLYASGSGDSSIGDDGVNGVHTGDGVVGESTSTGNLDNGVVGFSAGGYGIYGFSNGSGQYGGYFDDPISVNGGCTGCTMRYVARNTSQDPLQVGDVVQAAGIDAQMAGEQTPVMQVTRAESGDRVLGIVVGRTEMTIIEPSAADDVQPGPHYGPVGGTAEPGDYLVIVVQGMAQVRVAPTAKIQTGDMIGVSAEGATRAVDAPSFGMVLDKVDSDGLAWVLVGFD
jgi:hypothetical protein